MNRGNKEHFNTIQAAIASYLTSVQDSLREWQRQQEKAEADAAKYKDGDSFIKETMEPKTAITRNACIRHKSTMDEILKKEIGALQKELTCAVGTAPSAQFVNACNLYRQFGIKPSRAEISALVNQSGGVPLAYAVLNATLQAVESPFRITYTDADTFDEDLETLKSLASEVMRWTPADLHGVAVKVFGGQQQPGAINGVTYDGTKLLIERSTFESTTGGLADMAKRWTADVLPSIEQLKSGNLYADEADAAEAYLADREDTGSVTVTEERKPFVPRNDGPAFSDIMAHYLR